MPNRTRIRLPITSPEEPDGPVVPAPPAPVEPGGGGVPDGDNAGPGVVLPTGEIQTKSPWGAPYAFPWQRITQWYELVRTAADPEGVPWQRLLATIPTESGGNERAVQRNPSNGDSFGLVQVVPFGRGWEGWHRIVRSVAGLAATASRAAVQNALFDPAINLRVGASILASFHRQHGTWDRASSAFFLGNPDWRGADTVNGNTGAAYRRSLDGLIREIEDAAGDAAVVPPVPPSPPPVSPVPVDPIAIIVGAATYSADYGWLDDVGLDYYHYGVGHGTTAPTQHTGIDVPLPCGSNLYTPAGGIVDCVGSLGTPRWGQSCGAYADTEGGGVGNVTILLDGGVKLTLGHCRQSLVRPGDRVTAGQQVATVGSMNGCHVHIECSVESGEDGVCPTRS